MCKLLLLLGLCVSYIAGQAAPAGVGNGQRCLAARSAGAAGGKVVRRADLAVLDPLAARPSDEIPIVVHLSGRASDSSIGFYASPYREDVTKSADDAFTRLPRHFRSISPKRRSDHSSAVLKGLKLSAAETAKVFDADEYRSAHAAVFAGANVSGKEFLGRGMFNETWALIWIGNNQSWREEICFADLRSPPISQVRSIDDISALLSDARALLAFASTDAFVSVDRLPSAKRFGVPRRTEYQIFFGGHGAALPTEESTVEGRWAVRITAHTAL